jgi:DNA replication protein DnaC
MTDKPCSLCGGAPVCEGLGYVRASLPVGHPDFGKLFPCPHAPRTVTPERVATLRNLSNLNAFADKTFATFSTERVGITPSQAASLQAALQSARAFADHPEGWLLLQGTYGCGKTHLAAAIGNQRLEHGETVLFITSPDLLDHLRSAYDNKATPYDDLFERVRTAPLLILDDLGVENPSAWAREKLFQLLNHRYSYHLPTVVTTNAPVDALDPRLRSRLLDNDTVRHMRITAPDHRTHQRDESDVLTDFELYSHLTFDSFDTSTRLTAADRRTLENVLRIAADYAAAPRGWLLFMGPYGTGKTHLAAAIGNAYRASGGDVMFSTVPDLLDYLRGSFSPTSTTGFDRRFQAFRQAELLILDDLGTESATPWVKEKILQLINHRYVARRATVLTTSRPVKELDPRIVNRLKDKRVCTQVIIKAPDYPSRLVGD